MSPVIWALAGVCISFGSLIIAMVSLRRSTEDQYVQQLERRVERQDQDIQRNTQELERQGKELEECTKARFKLMLETESLRGRLAALGG